MTDEQIRIAIAEACGIIAYDDRPDYGFIKTTGKACNVPNYPNDLNAMHEAEKVLNHKQQRLYFSELCSICEREDDSGDHDLNILLYIHSTARQRAEAFLRTMGKWKEYGGGRLVGSHAGRVGILRGAGNSIVPEVAAQFIKAYLACHPCEPV